MNKQILLKLSALTISFALLLLSFYPYVLSLIGAWNVEEYSHGYFIPILAALIGWHRLTEDKPDLSNNSWLGPLVLLAGFACLIIAQLSAFEPPAYYALVLGITGILLSFLGLPFVKTTAPALVYLLFCIPLPRLILVTLSAKLQLLSSSLGVFILQLIGVSVFQDGNIIDLGHEKLQVVEACSGLRYLFPLMSLSFLIAFLLKDKMWKRALIFISAAPITMLMNSARIAWVGILVNWKGPGMTEGLVHDLQGWTVFALSLVVLLAETWILMQIGKPKGTLRLEYLGLASGPLGQGTPSIKKPAIAAIALLTAFTVFQLSGIIQNREQIIPARPVYATFPTSIAGWQGSPDYIDSEILSELVLSDYVAMNYQKDEDAGVNLYIAYYEKQGIGASIHTPANCIPGGGWKITDHEITPVDLGNMNLPVSRMIIEKDGAKLLVYYWFSQRGRIMNEQYGAKFYLLVDSILKNRSDGALVRVTTPMTDEKADERLQAFIKDAYLTIDHYIPD